MNMFEAFKSFTSLNEEAFNLDDDGIKAADELIADDEFEDVVDIIDPNAKDEDELKDGYIGKGILDCNVCHSLIYKDMADIIEEDGVYNVGEECPYCAATDGFVAIGRVAPFNDEAAIEDAEEAPEDPIEVDDADLEVDLDDFDDIEVEDEALTESIDHVSVEADGKTADITTDGDDISVNISGADDTAEDDDIAEDDDFDDVEDEMIVPLDAEDEAEIDADDDIDVDAELPEEAPVEDIIDTPIEMDDEGIKEEVPVEEEPVEESLVVEKKKVQKPFIKKDAGDLSRLNALLGESEEDLDCEECAKEIEEDVKEEDVVEDAPKDEFFDVEEIDECTLDPMIEDCLKSKRSYVESYKTTAIKEVSDTSIVVEGILKTHNGKEHEISFVAEALDEQHPDNFKMSLMTESFKGGKMNFILSGKVDSKKLYTESVAIND